MGATIKDVAKLAKVNPSTVSRVIADSPLISDKTKKIVKEAMEQLGYHPNINARSLVNKTTQAIGLIMPGSAEKAFENPFFSEVIRGISTIAHQKKYSLYLSTGGTEEEIFDGVVEMVQGKRVDGIILLYSRVNDKIIDYLREQQFPFVVIGKPYKNVNDISFVNNNNIKASLDATNYLIKLGHSHIAFVGGSLDLVVTIDRLTGYKQALSKAKIPIRDEYIIQEELLRKGGQEAISELLSLESPPTALVVSDDLMSFGILNVLAEKEINVPNDLSIVSFNNVMLAEFSNPPLTSVDINILELGQKAIQTLIELISAPDQKAKQIIVPYKIVERDSCQQYML